MKTNSLLFTGLLILATNSMAQAPMIFCWPNPSIEGTPAPDVVPSPWMKCYATPDTQPGFWGIIRRPSHGDSYASFIRIGDGGIYNEGMSQIMNPFIYPGTYVFTVDLTHSLVYTPSAEPGTCYSALAIYGGDSPCHQGELLWESIDFIDTSWQTHSIQIEPTSPWKYLTFCPQYLYTCNGHINVLVDNLTCIEPVTIVKPGCGGSTPGSITITPPTALSGIMPYTYVWNSTPPTSSNTFTITGPGIYTVDISDSSGGAIHYEIEVDCD